MKVFQSKHLELQYNMQTTDKLKKQNNEFLRIKTIHHHQAINRYTYDYNFSSNDNYSPCLLLTASQFAMDSAPITAYENTYIISGSKLTIQSKYGNNFIIPRIVVFEREKMQHVMMIDGYCSYKNKTDFFRCKGYRKYNCPVTYEVGPENTIKYKTGYINDHNHNPHIFNIL